MSDESFFREVNQEIRHDRTRALWTRFGRLLIGVAVVAVLATAAYVAWRAYEERQANASGDRYLAALDLASAGNLAEAATQLEALTRDGYGAYPSLARMRIAAVRVAEGDPAAAIAALDGIAGDSNAPQPLRDMAAVRAAYILVDTGSPDDVRSRVQRLTDDDDALRFAARETLGLASWKAGDMDAAKTAFQAIRDDGGAPSGVALRAGLMLEMIAAGSVPPPATVPPAETTSATPAAVPPPAPATEPSASAVTTPTVPEVTPPAAATSPATPPAVEASPASEPAPADASPAPTETPAEGQAAPVQPPAAPAAATPAVPPN